MTRCSGGARHWFTYYGWVGSSSPVCRRCKKPNPDYDPDRDPYAVAVPSRARARVSDSNENDQPKGSVGP